MKKHAILTGINSYKHFEALGYARQDAESVADALKRCYGFSYDEITLMTDASKKPPEDRFAIENELNPDSYESDLDLLIFGFWGHGIWEGNQRYLCPMDVQENTLTDSGLPMKILQKMLGRIRAKNICLILDCCQNEVSTESRSAAQTMAQGEEQALDLLARNIVVDLKKTVAPDYSPTVVVLNSCSNGERAFESAGRRHGLFTAGLLEAMEKRCDNTEALHQFICTRVSELLRTTDCHQTPYYACAGGSNILLPVVKKGYSIFLNYRREGDAMAAKYLQKELERRKIRVFLDVNETMAGCRFDETLHTRIDESMCFVPLLSPGCFSRPNAMSDGDWVYREMLHAVHKQKPIIPIFAPGFSWNRENVPERVRWLRNVNGIEYDTVNFNAFFARLVNAVRQPVKLNHEAILKQMTVPYRAPVVSVAAVNSSGKPSNGTPKKAQRNKLASNQNPFTREWFEAVCRGEMNQWTIGGIIAGVVLMGIVLCTLIINSGTQDTRAEKAKETESVVRKTVHSSQTDPTDVSVEVPTDISTDVSTDVSADASTDVPTDVSTDVPTDVPTDAPTDVPTLTVPTDVSTLAEAYEKIPEDGTIILKHGVHEVPETITITKNVTISGDIKTPELVVVQGGEENVFHLQSGFAEIAGLTIQNEGNEDTTTASTAAVQFSAPLGVLHDCVFISTYGNGFVVDTKDSNPNVKNCIAQNCGDNGFSIGSGASGTFLNCTASGNVRSGMAVQDANSNPTVEDCHFIDSKGIGIAVIDGASGTFRNCISIGNVMSGMMVSGDQTNPTVEDCHFSDGKSYGILVWESASGTFRNCTVSGNEALGMQLSDDYTNAIVEDCIFEKNQGHGVYVCYGASGTFLNCTASENASSGMVVRGTLTNPTVEDCTFEKNQECGVGVFDGASGTFRRNKLSSNAFYGGIVNWLIVDAARDLVREGNTPNE